MILLTIFGCWVVEGEWLPEPPEYRAIEVKAQEFSMGCDSAFDSACSWDEQPIHDVEMTLAFMIDVTEVTRGEYVRLTLDNPSVFGWCSDCPVDNVTWSDAAKYANLRSSNEQLNKCYECENGDNGQCAPSGSIYSCDGWRLPTEAEWELAAGCGVKNLYSGSDDLNIVGWTSSNSSEPQLVGGKSANACGVHDMSGNLWEWVEDYYGHYSGGFQQDPTGPDSGVERVARGGSYSSEDVHARVVSRAGFDPDGAWSNHGFRLARTNP